MEDRAHGINKEIVKVDLARNAASSAKNSVRHSRTNSRISTPSVRMSQQDDEIE